MPYTYPYPYASALPLPLPLTVTLTRTLTRTLTDQRRVVVYYVLRLLLAPLWEALLLLDRLLFLQERGYAAQLLPLFDPTLSPRNYAVLGVRRPRGAPRGGTPAEGRAATGAPSCNGV